MKNTIVQVDHIIGIIDEFIVFYENGFNKVYRYVIPNTVTEFMKKAKAKENQYGTTYTKEQEEQ